MAFISASFVIRKNSTAVLHLFTGGFPAFGSNYRVASRKERTVRKALLATAMLLILTVGAFAQRGPRAQAGNQGPATALKNALNLTDAQASAIQALVQASQQQSKTIMTDLRQKRQALESLLNATSPNPTDIGNA